MVEEQKIQWFGLPDDINTTAKVILGGMGTFNPIAGAAIQFRNSNQAGTSIPYKTSSQDESPVIGK